MDAENQINHPDYIQLRFIVTFEKHHCEVFATVPKNEKPTRDRIIIQAIGIVGDVMIAAEDLDQESLLFFETKAFEKWTNEMS
jgi:hypothetical protein